MELRKLLKGMTRPLAGKRDRESDWRRSTGKGTKESESRAKGR